LILDPQPYTLDANPSTPLCGPDQDNEWKRTQLRELAMINGTMRDDNDHFKDEMRQLARVQNGLGMGGGTADAPWRLNVDQQEQQMSRDWDIMTGAAAPRNILARPPQPGQAMGGMPFSRFGGPPQPAGAPGQLDGEYSNLMSELSGKPKPPQPPMAPPGGGVVTTFAVWVGGLPPHFDDNHLTQLFGAYGDISSCSVVKDRATGLSRNFGFVNFKSQQDAETAIQNVNGQQVEGRTIQARLKGAPPAVPGLPLPGAQATMTMNSTMPWARPPQPPGAPPPVSSSPYGPPGGMGGSTFAPSSGIKPPQPSGMPPGMQPPGMNPAMAAMLQSMQQQSMQQPQGMQLQQAMQQQGMQQPTPWGQQQQQQAPMPWAQQMQGMGQAPMSQGVMQTPMAQGMAQQMQGMMQGMGQAQSSMLQGIMQTPMSQGMMGAQAGLAGQAPMPWSTGMGAATGQAPMPPQPGTQGMMMQTPMSQGMMGAQAGMAGQVPMTWSMGAPAGQAQAPEAGAQMAWASQPPAQDQFAAYQQAQQGQLPWAQQAQQGQQAPWQQQQQQAPTQAPQNPQQLDSEYAAFMSEMS
jgi:hypothetical protein